MPIESNIPNPELGPNEEMFYVIAVEYYGSKFYAQCDNPVNSPIHGFYYETLAEAEERNKIAKGKIQRLVINLRTRQWYLVENPHINNKPWRRGR
jgi:hypothetical protein